MKTKEPYTKAFKRIFDDSEVKNSGTIKRLSTGIVEQKLVIASSDEVLEDLKGVIYEK